ncbi:hypothetical protein LTS10_004953 [Elasticomyces elasticus]|nr:hypothetical protein LTS10_004953 [Elasticomyces elasticus]
MPSQQGFLGNSAPLPSPSQGNQQQMSYFASMSPQSQAPTSHPAQSRIPAQMQQNNAYMGQRGDGGLQVVGGGGEASTDGMFVEGLERDWALRAKPNGK